MWNVGQNKKWLGTDLKCKTYKYVNSKKKETNINEILKKEMNINK